MPSGPKNQHYVGKDLSALPLPLNSQECTPLALHPCQPKHQLLQSNHSISSLTYPIPPCPDNSPNSTCFNLPGPSPFFALCATSIPASSLPGFCEHTNTLWICCTLVPPAWSPPLLLLLRSMA